MTSKQRMSASVDAELVAVAQEAVAAGQAESVSAWVNDALRLKADHDQRLRALDEFLAGYEAEHGEISEEEMRDAARSARGRAFLWLVAPDAGPGCGGVRRGGARGSRSGGAGEAGAASGAGAGDQWGSGCAGLAWWPWA